MEGKFNKRSFYLQMRDFRASMTRAYEEYDRVMKRLEPFKDSENYEKNKAEVEKTLREEKARCRDTFRGILCNSVDQLDACVNSVVGKNVTPPSEDQLRLLKALEMQSTLSTELLVGVGKQFEDSPLVLGALRELANKKNVRWPASEFNTSVYSQRDAKVVCNNIRSSINDLLYYMERPGDYRYYIHEGRVPMYMISIDKEFENADSLLRALTLGSEEEYQAFLNYVSESPDFESGNAV